MCRNVLSIVPKTTSTSRRSRHIYSMRPTNSNKLFKIFSAFKKAFSSSMIAMVTTSEWGFESAETIVNQDILIFLKNLKSFCIFGKFF